MARGARVLVAGNVCATALPAPLCAPPLPQRTPTTLLQPLPSPPLLPSSTMEQLRGLLPALRTAVASSSASASSLLERAQVALVELPSAVSATATPSEEELTLTRA
jgi:hypothetical protein